MKDDQKSFRSQKAIRYSRLKHFFIALANP